MPSPWSSDREITDDHRKALRGRHDQQPNRDCESDQVQGSSSSETLQWERGTGGLRRRLREGEHFREPVLRVAVILMHVLCNFGKSRFFICGKSVGNRD